MTRPSADEVRRKMAELSCAYPELSDFQADLAARLSDTALRALPGSALAVITPDGLAQGLHRTFLHDHGAHVTAFRFRNLTQRTAERLYRDGLITDRPDRHISAWWIKRKVFDLGEALVLLLRHPDDMAFQSTVTTAKGASDPLLARPGTYREAHRTPNKTFALMHSSDDILSLLYEAAVLFEGADLEDLLTRPYWPEAVRSAVSAVESDQSMRRIQQYRVVYRLKRRLMLEVAAVGRIAPCALEELESLHRRALAVVMEDPGHRTETLAVAALLSEERALLDGLVPAAVGKPECHPPAVAWAMACLRALTRPEEFDATAFAELTATLTALGIPLSPLELTVLQSLCHFYPRPLPAPIGQGSAGHRGD